MDWLSWQIFCFNEYIYIFILKCLILQEMGRWQVLGSGCLLDLSKIILSILKMKVKVLVIQLCLTLCDSRTVACQAPLSMGSSRQEYWSGQPFPSPGDLLDPGIKLRSPALQAGSLPSETPGKPSYSSKLHKLSIILNVTKINPFIQKSRTPVCQSIYLGLETTQ